MTTSDLNTLNIFLHEKHIGTLSLLAGDNIFFSFREDYINDSNRDTLSLSFKSSTGNLVTDLKTSRTRLNPFFSNLLPEGYLREYLAKKARINPTREFFLLHILGKDLPGALRVETADRIEIFDELLNNETEAEKNTAMRFSLAGVQLKFSALMNTKGNLTIPAQGIGGEWIVKLPSMSFKNVPENEYSMMMLAKQVGIDVPEIKLVELSNIEGLPQTIKQDESFALSIKRFDRSGSKLNDRIHIEDFAQVFGVYAHEKYKRGSYKNIAEVLAIETDEESIVEFIRRLVFNTLIGNADMHLKNWSLIYPDRQKAKLAPAYDFVSTIAYINDPEMALNYLKTKHMNDLSLDLLRRFAAKVNLAESLVINTAKQVIIEFKESWESQSIIDSLPIEKRLRETINSHIQKLRIFNEIISIN